MKALLDAIDWQILAELQADGRMTNVELARRVGISAPPCLRRVRALEEAGLIRGYRALLDEKALGFDIVAYAMVGLVNQSESDLVAFEARVAGWSTVRECYAISGEADFILKCAAKDFSSFQAFVIDELTKADNIASVRTALTLRRVKDAGVAPVE
ncbi:Lrp/AsnC family transcriptional regulator [Ahrensia marina]|jgi:DNA-binding Lrp family transcriptional regulator|uniref:Lrp/AsnC family transcriptional regulator n=1 Tax=Ahrensia marina TaxID=1514904 RepID=UPI0035CEDF00